MTRFRNVALAIVGLAMLVGAKDTPDYRSAAQSLETMIRDHYAYPEKLPEGRLPQSAELDRERDEVKDSKTLLRYAEDRITTLADHHAITGRSFSDSWAVIPTYADLWIVRQGNSFIVDAVRDDSPAAAAGIRAGDSLVSIDGAAVTQAIEIFWSRLGLSVTSRRADYAARVLAAGRRDRSRKLSFKKPDGTVRDVTLPSLYRDASDRPVVSVAAASGKTTIRFNNSLGDSTTIAAFDQAIAGVPLTGALVLDLRDTPSGGNTTVARAIMGWFVDRARSYQIHNRPDEERETGIARQWVEQVMPRRGKYRSRLPTILVGRWTGSMGEGLAIGFAAIGADIVGGPMAELNGSVEDFTLGKTDLIVKIPTERLMTVTGAPRENFRPEPPR